MKRPLILVVALAVACAGADGDNADDVPSESDGPGHTHRDDTADTAETDEAGPLDETDTDTDTDDSDVVPGCPSKLLGTLPLQGATGVFSHPDLRISFSRDETATATFALSRGAQPVALEAPTWSPDGRIATFRPVEPLRSSSAHILSITWSCGSVTLGFTTGAVGPPVADPEGLLGTTYVTDLRNGQVVEPAALATVAGGLFQNLVVELALVPESHDPVARELGFYAGWVDDFFHQDVCDVTIDVPPADFSDDPFFELVVPDGLSVPVLGASIFLDDLVFTGGFTTDGGAIEGLRLSGVLDVRDLAALTFLSGADICTLLGTLSGGRGGCTPCPDGSGTFCLDAVLGNVRAVPMQGVTLQKVTPQDILDNPLCP